MDPIAVAAASGLHSRMEALDMLSNNLANSTTGGFKLDREFYSLFQAEEGSLGKQGSTLPVIQKQWTDFQQGLLQPTGNSLDLALSGKGFFAVNGASGTLYTRNGAFKLSPTGVLTTMDGYPVRAVGGSTIQAQGQAPLEVSQDGSVRQDGQELGQLDLVDFADPNVLTKMGNSYFKLSNTKIQPTAATGATVEQGKIEASNVVAAESSVRLVELMRQYEMLQKAVSVAGEMNKKATDEVARVGA
jgi:flagellar basal-body rod protein FlgF